MSAFDIDVTAVRAVAQRHNDGARGIEELAASMPTSADTGPGADYLATIVATLAKDIGDLAALNRAVATEVLKVVALVSGDDAAAAAVFADLAVHLQQESPGEAGRSR